MSDINIPALEKLIDVVASGIGATAGPLLLPYKAKMQAKTDVIEAKGKAQAMKIIAQGKADSTKLIAQAQAEAKDILIHKQDNVSTERTNIEMGTANLIQTKIQFQERKRLNNIQNISIQAKDKLPEQVTNKPVDPDWTARFFHYAQDISTEEIQQIWSSILAGEVETPGRTSLRTLDILKNMTQKDAELFSTVMGYKVGTIIFSDIKTINDNYIPKYSDMTFLQEWGLIHTGSDIQLKRINHMCLGSHGDYLVRLYIKLKDKTMYIPIYKLTHPAIEISSFLNHSTDFNYLKLVARFCKKKGCQLQVAKILKKEKGEFTYNNNFKIVEP